MPADEIHERLKGQRGGSPAVTLRPAQVADWLTDPEKVTVLANSEKVDLAGVLLEPVAALDLAMILLLHRAITDEQWAGPPAKARRRHVDSVSSVTVRALSS